jgi:hypothetical protein
MRGRTGRFVTRPGERDALDVLLPEGIELMPDCLSCVDANDPRDETGSWITGVWNVAGQQRASLALPSARSAIALATPLIASFLEHVETPPVRCLGRRATAD